MKPKVSIIVPCYNQAHFLPEAIASVVIQTVTDWEVIIINDGSPDNTNIVAQRLIQIYPDYQIKLIEKTNGGPSDARNLGIQKSSGSYILPLDADDRLHPQILEKTLTVLETNFNIDIIYTNYQTFGTSSRLINCLDFNSSTIHLFNQLPYCSLYRRLVWEQVGGYNTNMTYGYEDWNFWISCSKQGFIAKKCSDVNPLFYYRAKASSRDTQAIQFDHWLKARIVMNHPQLFNVDMITYAELILTKPKDHLSNIIELVNQAENLIKNGDFSSATSLYQQWLWFYYLTSPLSYVAYFNLGVLFDQLEDKKSAIQSYQNALRQKPDFELAQQRLKLLTISSLSKDTRTSITDHDRYKSFCKLAAEDHNVFISFKQNPIYNEVLEHVTYEQGIKYLEWIKNNSKMDINKYLLDFKKNDLLGDPLTYFYPEFGKLSPTTIRYIKVAAEIENLFGSTKNMNIVEIGAGYGGQCMILKHYNGWKKYNIFDLQEVIMLQEKYLNNNQIRNYSFCLYENEYDLAISNYAFSEMPKWMQDHYINTILKFAKHGFMEYNLISDLFGIKSYSPEEICKIMNAEMSLDLPSLGDGKTVLITW